MPRRMKPPKYGCTGGLHSYMACFGIMCDLSQVGGQHWARIQSALDSCRKILAGKDSVS